MDINNEEQLKKHIDIQVDSKLHSYVQESSLKIEEVKNFLSKTIDQYNSEISRLKSDSTSNRGAIELLQKNLEGIEKLYSEYLKLSNSNNEEIRKLFTERLNSANERIDSLRDAIQSINREISSIREHDILPISQKISEISEKLIKDSRLIIKEEISKVYKKTDSLDKKIESLNEKIDSLKKTQWTGTVNLFTNIIGIVMLAFAMYKIFLE